MRIPFRLQHVYSRGFIPEMQEKMHEVSTRRKYRTARYSLPHARPLVILLPLLLSSHVL